LNHRFGQPPGDGTRRLWSTATKEEFSVKIETTW
jgi:hypothetical protein